MEAVRIGGGVSAWLSLQPRSSAADSAFIAHSSTLKLS